MGLQLYGVDMQEPMAAPLMTCFAAYPCMQRLSLQELNVDVQAAGVLGSMVVQHTSGSSFLVTLELKTVYMCDLAWRAFVKGLAAGCQLHVLR